MVEVTFKKECSKQMVTVCQPQTGYQSHGYNNYNKGGKIELKRKACSLNSHDILCHKTPKTYKIETVINIATTGSYQHCKEIAQETCYNRPSAGPKPEQVRSQKGEKVIGAFIES